jgi:Mn-dependent DtxR family transcriptional regulator
LAEQIVQNSAVQKLNFFFGYGMMKRQEMGGIYMQIRESAEDYLEAILILSKTGDAVHSVDIATRLGVSKPSVSHAMKLLREDGYIAMDRYGTVSLLEKGSEIAERIYERHTILSQMLESLGVSPETAKADACKIEHDISSESFERIKQHFKERVSHEETAE